MSATVSTKWSRRSISITPLSSKCVLWSGSGREANALCNLKTAPEIGERTAASPDIKIAGLHHIRAVVVMEAEFAHGHLERHDAGCAGFQRNFFKTLHFPHRPAAARHKVLDIELRNLLASARAGVRHRHTDFDRIAGSHHGRRDRQVL